MYSLQTSVVIDGEEFNITNKGDFRMVLDCFNAMNDEELGEDYRVLATLVIFYDDFNSIEDLVDRSDILEPLLTEMYKFFNCGSESSPGLQTKRPLVDWNKDTQMICSAVNNVAKLEIRALEYLHWWTFMGYFMSVGESTMATVISIRDKIMNHKKLEKWEQEFRKDNPNYFIWKNDSVEEREALNLILGKR